MLVQRVRAPRLAQTRPPTSFEYGRMDVLLDRAMATARMGVWSCDLADNGLSWTAGVYDLFGLSATAALDRRQTVEMYTEESRGLMERLRTRAIAKGGPFTLDAQIMAAGGDLRWVRITGERARRADGTTILHGLKQDVTDDRLHAETLRGLAESDALTGLANRAVYERSFLNTQGAPPIVPLGALILFDLDSFKEINDRFGHAAGDACLREFATRLSVGFPDARLISRIGGDEFAVILGDVAPDTPRAQVARFLGQLRAPIPWREHLFSVAASSGIAIPADPYCYDPEELFVRADAALYAAKASSRPDRAGRL